jgi:alginate O-acetyltransferase complex protein AlgI
MLFNSYPFIFVFFPVVLIGFFLIGARHRGAAAGFLALASIFYYGWAGVEVLPLLLGSIAFNYGAGLLLTPAPHRSDRFRHRMLVFALVMNLGMLALIKYADFLVGGLNGGLEAAGVPTIPLLNLSVPVAGISFYTFTQIAFLVDCRRGLVSERSFVHYVLFVTYFPHLIAGPVLHHAQMMPQFARASTYRLDTSKLALGLAIFTFGLAKKLLVADPLGQYADLMFNGVRDGLEPSVGTAWVGVLAYTLQIYFDFSGYSDMAVGLSLCLGVDLPLNFMSPYKSTSIIEFWRRWHISLSTFLRDYLYVPLGGNRKGEARRYINLFLTMLLGGLWHGAAWTFVIWGALHGAFLMVNHLWRSLGLPGTRSIPGGRILGWALTFLCVMVAWVVFRAGSVEEALRVYRGMLGLNGAGTAVFKEFAELPYRKPDFFRTLAAGLFICLTLPPTITLARWVPKVVALDARPRLSRVATVITAVGTVTLLGFCVSRLGTYSPFLYFQF